MALASWRSLGTVIAFFKSLFTTFNASGFEDPVRGMAQSITDREALQHLKDVKLEGIWPAFANHTSLLALAFADQHLLPTPLGAIQSNMRQVSTSPLVYVIDNFLSPEECDFLRSLARYRLAPAMVVQSTDNWYNTQTETRNNEQLWLTPKEETSVPLLRHVLKRMHRFARVPDDFAEALQIGRYNVSTKYEVHIDTDPVHKVARPATLITYLNEVEDGGDTLFPVGRTDCGASWLVDPRTGKQVFGVKYCCETPEKDLPTTVRVHPKKGRSVLFFSHHPDGSVDHKSKHAGCPVTRGEKWIAQRWLRFEPYNRISYADMGSAGYDDRFDGLPTEREEQETTRTLSNRRPRIYLEERFMSMEECDALITLAKPSLNSSKSVGFLGTQSAAEQEVWITKLDEDKEEVLHRVAERSRLMARLPDLPHDPQPGVRISRLSVGGFEASSPPTNTVAATVLMFLNDVEEGGEYVFPMAGSKTQHLNCVDGLARCCAKAELKVRPRKGDAILIFSHTQDGRLDKSSEHASCPVVRGQRWIAERKLFWNPPSETPDESVQTEIVFQSDLLEITKVYWVDQHTQQETFLGDILAGPGSTASFNTFVSHRFRVRGESEQLVLEAVVKRPGKSTFKIIRTMEDKVAVLEL